MNRVRLKSRIPEINAEMSGRVDKAIRRGSEQIAARAASRAPVDTGRLRNSIEARPYKGGMGVYALFYANFIEFGTRYQSARPFLVPAAEEGKGELESLISAELKRL